MKKQRISAVLLTGVLALGMTGCGGNSKAKAYQKYVTLGDYKGIEYTKEVQEVTEDSVDSEVNQLLQQHMEQKEVDRAIESGDVVNIDYVGKQDGVEFEGGSAEGYDLEIGSHSFIDGFEDGLIGHKKGEDVTLELTFPDPYPNNTDLSGKLVTFDVKINTVSEQKLPELTDAFVKENTEYDTIDAYKEGIRTNQAEENENSAEYEAKNYVFNKVMDNCTVSGYDEEEAKQEVDRTFNQFKKMAESYASYGYTYEQVLQYNGFTTEDELKEGLTESVGEYLKQKMVIYCLADKEGIKVTDKEVEEELKNYMQSYGYETEQEVYDILGEDYFTMSLLSEKVMDFIMENAKQVDHLEESTETEEESTETEETSTETEETSTETEETEAETTETEEAE